MSEKYEISGIKCYQGVGTSMGLSFSYNNPKLEPIRDRDLQEIIADKIKAAASTGRFIMEIDFKKAPQIFHKGQVYTIEGSEYLIASPDGKHCALISLTDGNRWVNMVPVVNSDHITEEEFGKMCGAPPISEFKYLRG